jgi:hypothetical protein
MAPQPAESEARQRDSELRGREMGIEMGCDMPRKSGAFSPLTDERIKLAATHLYDREL